MNVLLRPAKPLLRIGLMIGFICMGFSLVTAQEGRFTDEPLPNTNSILHFSAPATNLSNWTNFSSPLTDNNLNAVVFYTHNWNATDDLSGTEVVPYPLGVWYSNSGQWSLFNQDQSIPFEPNTHFNIMAQGLGGNVFHHTSAASNISGDATVINNPLTNDKPNAILFVAANWTASSTYHNHSLGVYYIAPLRKWVIFNQEKDPMQPNVTFNVIVKEPSDTTFVHTKVTGDDPDNTYTPLNNPYLNNNPYAQVIVTQQYGAYNNSEVGVWYRPSDGRWYIYNEKLINIPNGTKFNVHVTTSNRRDPNVVINGGFEVPGESPKEAIDWTAKDKAKRKCNNLVTGKNFSHTGECAMMIKGKPGLASKIKQSGVMSGYSASFYGRFTGKNVNGGLKAVAKLTLNDGTKAKLKLDPTQLNSGTYELDLWQSTLVTTDIVAFKVVVKLIAPSGKVLVDDLGLSPMIALRSAEPLPLPALDGVTDIDSGPSAGRDASPALTIEGIPGQ